ncbi:MAG: hypothetical protein Q9M75_07490, partial [Ghiorsea sp.]|nr:hypothetical protein [Ghiorsea sp.]
GFSLTPPPTFYKGKVPSQMSKDKRKAIKKRISRPNPSDATNAIQNLSSTTDITIKPSFVKP